MIEGDNFFDATEQLDEIQTSTKEATEKTSYSTIHDNKHMGGDVAADNLNEPIPIQEDNDTSSDAEDETFYDTITSQEEDISKARIDDEFDQGRATSSRETPPPKSQKQLKEELLEARRKKEEAMDEETIKNLFDEAQAKKAEGNEEYSKNEIERAMELYTEALGLCPLHYKKERAIMYSNRASCYIRLEDRTKALEDCDDALELHPTYIKCLMRRAEQRRLADRLQESLDDYQKLLELDPNNGAARMACMVLPGEIKEQQEKLKAEMLNQLKQLGNLVLKPFGLSTDNFKMVQDPNTGGYSVNFSK